MKSIMLIDGEELEPCYGSGFEFTLGGGDRVEYQKFVVDEILEPMP